MDVIKIRFGTGIDDIHRHIQRLVHEMFNMTRPLMTTHSTGWIPDADIYETEEEIIMTINLAGVRKEDVEVFLYEDYIYIRGRRQQPVEESMILRYHQLEIGYGDFERAFHIPVSIDRNSIEAVWSDGLLRIHMKKQESGPRTIRVEVR